jgi:hypothetical protein
MEKILSKLIKRTLEIFSCSKNIYYEQNYIVVYKYWSIKGKNAHCRLLSTSRSFRFKKY